MAKKYLFSPIGNTDPIKYLYDGSMIHICRYYQPDVVYLYLSKEMMENHKKDNRYVKTLELLGEFLHHKFEIHIIENSDMIDVQQYDIFYNEFHRIIAEIEEQKGPEDILLVNMASGTPAMKSALLVMATLSEYRFLPIQVSTPQKKSNLEHEERDEYDVDANWELNMDNEETAENRCQEVKCLNLMRLLKIDMIKKHLLAYDYHAALAVGKEIKEDLSPVAYQWLETADARSLLDWTRMNRVLVKRGEYADFIRAITPLGVDLLEIVLEQSCDIDITRYYKRNNQRIWDKNRLVGEILDILNQKFYPFRYGPVYSAHLLEIIQKKCTDTLMVQRIQELVNIEQNVRNVAAHNIVSVTPEWIKERTGKSVDDILWILKYVCEQVKINTRKENWNSYDSMNKRIINELDKD